MTLLISPIAIALFRLRQISDSEEVYWLGILSLGLTFVAISCLAFFPFHLSITVTYIAFLLAGIRAVQAPYSDESVEQAGLVRPVVVGVLLVVVAGMGWQAVNSWRANKEAGIAAFLLRSGSSKDYRPIQKRAIADEALARLERAQNLAPDFHEVYNLKGSVLMMLGRYEQAVGSYSKGVEYIPSPELYTNLAAAYMAVGKKQKAKECLDLALSYSPRYRKARQARKFLESGR
jgi:tetratricopeptide (TPR) repeat protein